MKAGLVICGPDVAHGPLALLSGTFEEKARKAAAMGYDGIELMVRDPAHLDWVGIKSTLDAVGLEVPQIVTGELFGADGLCLVTPDEDLGRRAFERTCSVIDLAAHLGAYVNVGRLRGRLGWLNAPATAWDIAVERLAGVVHYAAQRGVGITLEPINRYETDFILTVADGLRMVHDLGSDSAGLMLDLFHMNIEEPSIEGSLRQAGSRIWHIHIADSNRLHPGSGHLEFASIFATLADMSYEGYVSAELFPRPDPDTAARKTIEFLRTYI
jgi:sugar phosphate isomerase/epimerase